MMTATKTRKKAVVTRPAVAHNNGTDDEYCVVVPRTATTLAGFREWSSSDAFPERGKITFVAGEVIVDMSPERLGSHNAVRMAIHRVVGDLVLSDDLGTFYGDGARFVHKGAKVSNEPDSMVVLWETFASGAVRDIPTKDGDDWIELEGTPDWVMEIVSPSSVTKDTVVLRERYHRAGVGEYWLIDVRGDKLVFTILIHHPDGYHAAPTKAGWQKSKVFGKQFRLIRRTDRRGRPAFRLEMK
jgi:Uma2 family endonuclease